MDIATQGDKRLLATILLLHGQQIIELLDLILLVAHVVVNDPHPRLANDLEAPSPNPVVDLFRQLRIGGGQGGLALLAQAKAHIVEIAHHQTLKQQTMTVVKKQRQYAPCIDEREQTEQGLARLGEPLQHGVTEHQIKGAGHVGLEILNGAMDETNSVFQPLFSDLDPCKFKHFGGEIAQLHLMTHGRQLLGKIAKSAPRIQDAQGPVAKASQAGFNVAPDHSGANTPLGGVINVASKLVGTPVKTLILLQDSLNFWPQHWA